MKKVMYLILLKLALFLCSCSGIIQNTHEKEEVERFKLITKFLVEHPVSYQTVKTSDKESINVFNPSIIKYIKAPADKKWAKELIELLDTNLDITLNKYSLPPAAKRNIDKKKIDETHYDAIWVRDSIWIYQALKRSLTKKTDANKLLLAIWDYFATPSQLKRLNNIIANPALKTEPMLFPHIRFDGNSHSFEDVIIDGTPQKWNHKQMDAYGLFLLSLLEAIKADDLPSDTLSGKRLEVLLKFPIFFSKVKFHLLEDSGAWEELERRNTSSISLVTRALELYSELRNQIHGEGQALYPKKWVFKVNKGLASLDKYSVNFWKNDMFKKEIHNGYNIIRKHLALGGESPDYPKEDCHFRKADVALLNLVYPSPLKKLTEKELRKVIKIVKTLIRPFGIIRYHDDSYQSGHFWFPTILKKMKKQQHVDSLITNHTSSTKDFLNRGNQLIKETEAQWFFDSWMALAYMQMAKVTININYRKQDIKNSIFHIKRALGQLTGKNLIAADGTRVFELQAPESINTVVINGKFYHLPSPISPLNWAKAKLYMALYTFKQMST